LYANAIVDSLVSFELRAYQNSLDLNKNFFLSYPHFQYEHLYVRLSATTQMDDLFNLLHDVWKLPQPRLVISVTGGAKMFEMKKRLKDTFKHGLTTVASTTGMTKVFDSFYFIFYILDAWIITGGTATGVMRLVGEAARV
jgi:transient receptor potential cation channel subfamily M protein 2